MSLSSLRRASLRRALTSVAAASALAFAAMGPAHANYEAGLAAYQAGEIDVAIDIWKRFAVAGDTRSMKVLGDVYSGRELLEDLRLQPRARAAAQDANLVSSLEIGRQVDNVEALRWYTLAAYHRFEQGLKNPSAEERNAQIVAEERLTEIRFRMSNLEVKKAEKLVADTLERGSAFSIYTLGDMYQRGAGVSKNNVRALELYEVAIAKDRVKQAVVARDEIKALMSRPEIEAASSKAAVWQPPLPEEHVGQTEQQKELDRARRELEELRLQSALGAIADIDVELIQSALRALGYYYGPLDNSMGPATREAIRKFQASRFLAIDNSGAQTKPKPNRAQDNRAAGRPGDRSDAELELAAGTPFPGEADAEARETLTTGVLSARQTVQLFEAAANAQHPMSQYVFGIMHAQGIGVIQDGSQALYWLEEAAKSDLANAHYALGVLYRDGTPGLNPVTPNRPQAAIHFARASALGSRQAAEALRTLEFERPRPRN